MCVGVGVNNKTFIANLNGQLFSPDWRLEASISQNLHLPLHRIKNMQHGWLQHSMLQNADPIKYVGDKNKDSGKHSKNSQHRSRWQGNSKAQNTNMLLLMINQNQSQHFWVVVCVTLMFNMRCLLMGVLTVHQLNINKWYFTYTVLT